MKTMKKKQYGGPLDSTAVKRAPRKEGKPVRGGKMSKEDMEKNIKDAPKKPGFNKVMINMPPGGMKKGGTAKSKKK